MDTKTKTIDFSSQFGWRYWQVKKGGEPKISAFFSKPFFSGMARVLDIGATLRFYDESKTPEEADYIALSNDWKEVGNDLMVAIKQYDRQNFAK